METIYNLYELSNRAKHKFYTQEALDDFSKLKFLVLGLILTIPVLDILISTCMSKTIIGYQGSWTHLIVLSLIVAFAIVAYFFSYSTYLQKIGPKGVKIRVFLSSFAGILFGVNILFINWIRVDAGINAPESEQEEAWLRAYMTVSYAIYTILLFMLISPLWIIRMLIPICYYIGMTLPFIIKGHPQLVWVIIRNAISILYAVILTIIISKYKWGLFLKNFTAETWNHVYRDILNRNPSSILAVDQENNIIYSNAEFQKASNNDPKSFLNRIIKLKSRSTQSGPGKSMDVISSAVSLNPEETKILLTPTPDSKTAKPIAALFKRGITMISFQNMSELIRHYIYLLEDHKLDNQDQVVFDGKYISDDPSSNVILSYEVIIRPLTEYKTIVVILNNTTERDLISGLENTNDFKDQLLASISHELRTPLNANLGFLQAACDDEDIPLSLKTQYIVPALRSGKLLLHLINDILDYSKIQNEKIQLSYEHKSLKETIEYCYQLVEHAFMTKNLTFDLIIDDRIPPTFKTDHDRLAQIVLNLLTNALKFTEEGSVIIHVDSMDDWHVKVSVEDTGMGIEPRKLVRLFEENNFIHQDDIAKDKHSKGVGLGLKIANRLAKLLDSEQNRDIEVKTVLEKGTTFSFYVSNIDLAIGSQNMSGIPIKIFDLKEEDEILLTSHREEMMSSGDIPHEFQLNLNMNPTHPTVHQSIEYTSRLKITGSSKGRLGMSNDFTVGSEAKLLPPTKRILIVDDDPFNILALKSLLNNPEIILDTANNGKQAVDKVIKDPSSYQLIIMDCQMPVMSGYEATRELTKRMKDEIIPEIPIVGCTAFSAKDKIEECLSCGMREVIHKPVIKKKLLRILGKYLD